MAPRCLEIRPSLAAIPHHVYVIISLFYPLHLSPRDLWLSNSRHRKQFPRFWVRRHILWPQFPAMLGKHEPLSPIFLSIRSLHHHACSNVSILSWYEMLTSLSLLYGKPVSELLFLWLPQVTETITKLLQCIPPPSSFFAASLLRRETVATTALYGVNICYPMAPASDWTSCFPWNLKELCSFFPPSLWNGFRSCQHELDSHLWLTVMWLSPSLGLRWTTNPVSPLQTSLLHLLLLPLALTLSLWTGEGLSGCYFCFSYETPCGPCSLFFKFSKSSANSCRAESHASPFSTSHQHFSLVFVITGYSYR